LLYPMKEKGKRRERRNLYEKKKGERAPFLLSERFERNKEKLIVKLEGKKRKKKTHFERKKRVETVGRVLSERPANKKKL